MRVTSRECSQVWKNIAARRADHAMEKCQGGTEQGVAVARTYSTMHQSHLDVHFSFSCYEGGHIFILRLIFPSVILIMGG